MNEVKNHILRRNTNTGTSLEEHDSRQICF